MGNYIKECLLQEKAGNVKFLKEVYRVEFSAVVLKNNIDFKHLADN